MGKRFSSRGPTIKPCDSGVGGVGLFAVSFLVGLAVTALVLVAARALSGADRASITDLVPGDCFVLPIGSGDTTIDVVEPLNCDEPHDAEVVAVGLLNPSGTADYPADRELFRRADVLCGDPRRFLDQGFGVLPVAPDAGTWRRRKGAVVCVAVTTGERMVVGRQIDVGAGSESSVGERASEIVGARLVEYRNV